MLRLDELILWDFRAINRLRVELQPYLTVLIVDNGIGKTPILDSKAILMHDQGS